MGQRQTGGMTSRNHGPSLNLRFVMPFNDLPSTRVRVSIDHRAASCATVGEKCRCEVPTHLRGEVLESESRGEGGPNGIEVRSEGVGLSDAEKSQIDSMSVK
jgi:hypothetical protein